MPLVKKALQPVTSVVENTKTTLTSQVVESPKTTSSQIQPATLDAKSRQIQRQGAFQAALQSVGVVQHGGKSFEDYLLRVRQAADAELGYINE